MWVWLKKQLGPPQFVDEAEARRARLLNLILLWFIALTGLYTLTAALFSFRPGSIAVFTLPLVVIFLIARYLLGRGRLKLASLLFTGGFWVVLSLYVFLAGGVRAPGFTTFAVVVLVAGLLLGEWAGVTFAGLTVMVGGVAYGLEAAGALPTPYVVHTLLTWCLLQATTFIVIAGLFFYAVRSQVQALARARREVAERQRAEAAARDSEDRYRLLFESNPQPMWVYDCETLAFLAVNDAAVRHYGYSRDEFLRMTVADIRPSEDVPALPENVRRVTAGRDEAGVWRHRLKNGALIKVEVVSHTLTFAGRPAELVLATDVTARLEVEAAQRASDERFRRITEASPMGMHFYRLEAEGRLIFLGANPAADRILGIQHAALIGQTIETAFPALAGAEIPDRYRAVAAHGGLWQTEQVEYRDDRIAGAFDVYAFRTAPGEMAVWFLEVTERRRAEEDLLKFRYALEKLTDAVFMTNPDGVIRYVNPAFEQVYGYRREEALGRTPRILKSGLIPPEQYQQFWRTLLDGQVVAGEIVNRTCAGRLVPVEAVNSPILDQSGRMIGFIAVHRDITERKRAEAALSRRDVILRAVNYAAEHFLKAERWETQIQAVLGQLGQATEASRVYLFENHAGPDGALLTSQRYEWAAAGVAPQIDNADLQNVPLAVIPRWVELLAAGRRVAGPVRGFPPEERAILEPQGILSLIVIPITVGGAWWGFVGFDDCAVEREWSAAESEALEAAVHILSAAIQRERTELALRRSEERYALAAQGANDGLWDVDLVNATAYYSPRWKAILGCADDEIGAAVEDWLRRVHPDDVEQVKARLAAHLEGATPHFESEHRLRRRDGLYLWVLSRGLAVRREDGMPYRMAGSMTDITERKRAEAQMQHDAFHDGLTGLPNRALFVDRLEQAVKHARRREGYAFAVLFLDVDRFKVVNDSLGHTIGDRLLVAIAQRLARGLRAADTLARLGGDEFVILLDDIHSPDEAAQIANRIQEQLAQPFDVGGLEVVTSASIGIVLSDAGHERTEDLLRDADITMYRAKAQGRARYEVFNVSMRADAMARLSLEADLRRALERGEFCVHYQPIVSLRDGRTVGFEALLRWQHPERGLVPPAQIIPLAEESGLIIAIDYWVMAEACRQLRLWREQFPVEPSLTLNVNLSGRHFSRPDLASRIEAILQATGVPAHGLRLEITESVIMENITLANVILQQLHALGLKIEIDDFGTGYSSLGYLVQLPVDTLKIDRSFVSRMTHEAGKAEIVQTIVTLARNLGMTAIAEGIETIEQRDRLAALGCDHGQGYLIAMPLEAEAATAWLAGRLTPP